MWQRQVLVGGRIRIHWKKCKTTNLCSHEFYILSFSRSPLGLGVHIHVPRNLTLLLLSGGSSWGAPASYCSHPRGRAPYYWWVGVWVLLARGLTPTTMGGTHCCWIDSPLGLLRHCSRGEVEGHLETARLGWKSRSPAWSPLTPEVGGTMSSLVTDPCRWKSQFAVKPPWGGCRDTSLQHLLKPLSS